VFVHGLKTKIAIHLTVLLVLAMILLNFVMIITERRDLIGAEITRGYTFISGMEANIMFFPESDNITANSNFRDDLGRRVKNAGFSCAMFMDAKKNRVYSYGEDSILQDEIEAFTRQTIRSKDKATRFSGSTWGIWGKQSRNLIISAPLFRDGSIIAGLSIVLPLEGIHKTLRRTQYILLIYIFINTFVFSFIGFCRLSRIIVKPLQRLVKRAEEYREDDEVFFLYEKEDNDFSKLSKALNSMLKQIADDKERLRTTVMSLETANIDLKQVQKEIIQAEKLASVGRLSSGIAHEMGNPIGIVVGYLELLKQNDISEEDKKEFILRTENEINRVNTIIRQLLDFSRPSSEALKAVSVHSIIRETIDVFKFQPLMSKVELNLGLNAKKDRVMADSNQLRQVFLNLLINAADAISSVGDHVKGKISITSEVVQNVPSESEDRPNLLKISYIDNGPGIAKENLGNIFDPFYTTKEPGKGTGLGLSVSFMIIQGIGGKIQASSEQGNGATINIYLPLIVQAVNGETGNEKLDMDNG
jgi:two-component system, NtrC family, sensor kinase